jgi:hypothetical protein
LNGLDVIDVSNVEFGAFAAGGMIFPLLTGFDKSTFAGQVDFRDAVFGWDYLEIKALSKTGSQPSEWHHHVASFIGVRFSERANFRESIICGNAVFVGICVHGNVSFTNATFSRSANFGLARFFNYAPFTKTAVRGRVFFSGRERDWKPDTGQTIERLYAWIAEEPDGEGVAWASCRWSARTGPGLRVSGPMPNSLPVRRAIASSSKSSAPAPAP